MGSLGLAIGLGLTIALLFGELFGLGVGGMIVPGYAALYLNNPWSIGATLGVALLTYALVHGASLVLTLYGRRRTALTVLVGYLMGMSVRWALEGDFWPGQEVQVIGYIIPGLIAIWFQRQGVIDTLVSLITASAAVRLLMVIILGEVSL